MSRLKMIDWAFDARTPVESIVSGSGCEAVQRAVGLSGCGSRPSANIPHAPELYKRTVLAHTPRVAPVPGKHAGTTVGSRLLYFALASPMLVLGLYVWPAADDFGYWNMAQSAGSPITFATSMYQNWSGRFAHSERRNRPGGQIRHRSNFDRSGHYAAMQTPDLLTDDIRTFFSRYR